MILVTNRLQVAPGFEAELEERFRRRAGRVEDEPGFVRMVVLRPVTRRKNRKTGAWEQSDKTQVFQIQTWWDSEEAFWDWTKSESFRAAHAHKSNPDMYAGPPVMEIHEVAIDTA